MPKKSFVKLFCGECKSVNYYVHKSKGKLVSGAEKKIELKKFCRRCKKHTLHKEGKK